MREVRRANSPQPVPPDADAIPVELRHHRVHAIRVPRQHDVGFNQLRELPNCRLGYLLPPAASGPPGHRMGTLQLDANRLARLSRGCVSRADGPGWLSSRTKQRSQQAPKVFCSGGAAVANRCWTPAGGWYAPRTPCRSNRRRQAHQVVPAALDRLTDTRRTGDALQAPGTMASPWARRAFAHADQRSRGHRSKPKA